MQVHSKNFSSVHLSLAIAGLLAMVSGCATVSELKKQTPSQLFSSACSIGRGNQKVTGSVWMLAKSKEATGQFPANVEAEDPAHLKLQVTDLINEVQAEILISGDDYKIDTPLQKKSKTQKPMKGTGNWGGIPLRWATELFMGRIPCPTKPEAQLKLGWGEDSSLRVEMPIDGGSHEVFLYRFRSFAGGFWPEEVDWERTGIQSSHVHFKFDDPDTASRNPKKWEATSDRGEVKLRWKDRAVVSR